MNFGVEWWLSVVRFKEKKENTPATRGFIHATECVLWMRTSERGTAASSCVARRVAVPDAAALPRRQSTPPAQHCSKPYPLEPSFVVLQISPKI